MSPKDNIPLTARALRIVPFAAFIFTFAGAIPYATEFDHVLPLFGFIPFLGSIALSCYALGSFKWFRRNLCCCFGDENQYYIRIGEDDGQPAKPIKSSFIVLLDACLAALHLLIFSLTIFEMATYWYGWSSNEHGDILGTFLSMAFLTTGMSHTGLMVIGIKEALANSHRKLTNCPHCQKSLYGKVDSQTQVITATQPSGSPAMTPASGNSNIVDV